MHQMSPTRFPSKDKGTLFVFHVRKIRSFTRVSLHPILPMFLFKILRVAIFEAIILRVDFLKNKVFVTLYDP